MGNVISTVQGSGLGWWHSAEHRKAILNSSETFNPVTPISEARGDDINPENYFADSDTDVSREKIITRTLSPEKAKELENFRKELALKRKARSKLIAEKSNEMEALRAELKEERRSREEAVAENTALRALIATNNGESSIGQLQTTTGEINYTTRATTELQEQLKIVREQNRQLRKDLCEANCALQSANAETALLNKENFEIKNQISALKEVKRVSKEMLDIRENQLAQLKSKLSEIEQSLADREMRTLSDDLKQEYERQLQNIRNLRVLYEERARAAEVTRHGLLRELDEQKILAESRLNKCTEFEAQIEELVKQLSEKDETIRTMESQLGFSKAESKGLQSEMTVINQLFSQMLLGYNNNQDLDKLLLKLEENHDLLQDMVVREDCSETASALPKLILDLVNQVDASELPSNQEEESTLSKGAETSEDSAVSSSPKSVTSAKEIVGNLPKVWRVLMELLSHQSGPPLVVSEISEKSAHSCYKSVETPSGPRMVPSVSKTYIRLKDLILEKKSLQKEMNRLKQLNSHLESRLQDQGRRLGLVSSELGKTWHVVGRMERQHQQIHTHEKILRYELQQKRKLLTELKEELEFCKEKWDRAKQKNSETQIEWDKLRIEFASRKLKSTDSINNSAESGYSDGRASDEDSDTSDSEKISERKRLKKKAKSPDLSGSDKTRLTMNDETVDSDVLQDDEEGGIDATSTDVTQSDCETQANLADAEDQSVSEILSKNDEASEEEATNNQDESEVAVSPTRSNSTCYDDVLAARAVRLKKLEEQCYVLVHKVTKTNSKGVQLCNRLEELHNQYGGAGGADQPSTSSTVTDNANDRLNPESNENIVKEELAQTDNGCIEQHSQDGIPGDNYIIVTETGFESVPSDTVIKDEISNITQNTDSSVPGSSGISDYESRFAARDERFRIMEEQAKSLVNKVSNTSTRSVEICSRLDELHCAYGRSEAEHVNATDNSSDVQPSASEINEQPESDNANEKTHNSYGINSPSEQRNDDEK